MGSVANLCTPKNGEILISATQDFLTCAFLLSSKDRFFNRSQFCQLVSFMGDGLDDVSGVLAGLFSVCCRVGGFCAAGCNRGHVSWFEALMSSLGDVLGLVPLVSGAD